MMRIAFSIVLLFPSVVLAQSLNAGFVQGIWFSKTPFFAGDAVRVYSAIQNNSGFDIQGTVEFVVNGKSVGQAPFSAVQGRIVETWTDWHVQQGSHAVGARIKEAFKVEIGKDPEPISLGSAELRMSEVFVDHDTDGDQVGNQEDPDDDNDGLEDTEEEELGTDPLEEDTDQDGVSDGQELAAETDPLSAQLAEENPEVQEQDSSLAQRTLQKAQEEIDEVVAKAVESLKAQREKLQGKKEQSEPPLAPPGDERTPVASAPEEEPPPFERPAPELSLQERALDTLLAAAIVGLPQWRTGALLFALLLILLWVRRSSRREY